MDRNYSNGSNHSVKREDDGTVDVDGLNVEDNGTPIINLYYLLNSEGKKTWEKNKKYIYKATLSAEADIEFGEPIVQPWVQGESTGVIIPR
jgi:hypothetical protein